MTAWEPIGTAPMDGKIILLRKSIEGENSCVGFWDSDSNRWIICCTNYTFSYPTEWTEVPE